MKRPEEDVRLYHSDSTPFAVDVHLDTYEGMSWIKRRLRAQSGWLQVAKASMDTLWGTWSSRLVVAMTDHGDLLERPVANALLEMRSANVHQPNDHPDEMIEGHMEMAYWDFLGRCDVRHLKMLDDAEAEMALRLEEEQARGEDVLVEVELYIAQLHRLRRMAISDIQREDLASRIALLDQKHAEAADWLVRRLATIRREGDAFAADILASLQNHGEMEVVQTVRWVTTRAIDQDFEDGGGFTLPPSGSVPEDGRGSVNPAELLHAAQRLGRMHSKIPLIAHLPERRDERTRATEERKRLERPKLSWREDTTQAIPDADIGSVEAPKAKLTKPKLLMSPRVASEETTRVQDNARLLREKALQKQTKVAAAKLARDMEVQALIDLYGSAEALDRCLAEVPSMGIESRRLSRLIREAITRITSTDASLASPTGDVAFPGEAPVRTSPQLSPASVADDSIEVDALIKRDLADKLKDLQ